MPKTFLENNAPGFLKVYDEYYKQVQYKMTAFEKCEDPNNVDPFGFEVLYPTDTYYPKGITFFRNILKKGCRGFY